MRWKLFCCLLLASAHDIVSTPRPKRDLWSVKNFISSKLFGTETIAVQLPTIPKNETYQLFRIKGHDNLFLKVTRKPERRLPLRVQYEESMPSPEMGIIGNYLGTDSQRETMLALEIARNLLKSGILKHEAEKNVHEVLMPMAPQMVNNGYIIREPVNPIGAFTEERVPIMVNAHTPHIVETDTINVVNHPSFAVFPPEHPPMVVASQVKYNPYQSKYSYKQETEDADITYESHNNHGVAITRTNKVPVKPNYIAVRLADVVSIAANPYMIRPQQPASSSVVFEEHLRDPLNVVPIPSYVMNNPPETTPSAAVVKKGYVDHYQNYIAHLNSLYMNQPKYPDSPDMPNFVKQSNLPFDIRNHLNDGDIDKLNQFINSKLYVNKNNQNVMTLKPPTDEKNVDKVTESDLKFTNSGSQINVNKSVSRYSYTQIGDIDDRNFTVVKIEDPKLNLSEIEIKSSDEVPQNYVYIPPNDVLPPVRAPNPNNLIYIPPALQSPNNINENNRYDDYDSFSSEPETYHKVSAPITLRGDLTEAEAETERSERPKTNQPVSLSKNPIVVPMTTNYKQTKIDKAGIKAITGRPITGGQSTDRTAKPFIGGQAKRTTKTTKNATPKP